MSDTDIDARGLALRLEHERSGQPGAEIGDRRIGLRVQRLDDLVWLLSFSRALSGCGRPVQRATILANDGPDALVIRIRDAGPGIPEAELERVFEPFYRIEGSRSRDTGGSGLGLSIARDIARLHQGTLVLRNAEGGGLEAVLTLPRA